MLVIKYVIACLILKRILSIYFYGWFKNKPDLVYQILNHKQCRINQYETKMLITTDGYISKSDDDILCKWHVRMDNGVKFKIYRYSELSKVIDDKYNELYIH